MYPRVGPNKNFKRCLWLIAAFLFLASSCAPGQARSATLDEIGTVEEIRTLLPSEWEVPHPTGLSYSLGADQLYLLEKRSSDPAPAGQTTVAIITPYEDWVGAVSVGFPVDNHINVAFDDGGDRLLLLNNELAELAQVEPGNDGVIDPATLTRVDVAHLGLANVQGMDVDVQNSRLFLLDSGAFQVVIVNLDAGFGLVSKVDISHLCAPNLRGLAVHPASGNLFVVSPTEKLLYELTQSGQLVHRYDLANLALIDPRGLDFGPSADLTDPPATIHLFMADSNMPAAKVYLPLMARWHDRAVVTSRDIGVSVRPETAPVFGRVLEVALHPGSPVNPAQRITLQVASSHDDAEEKQTSGAVDLVSTDLELVRDGGVDQLVGLRFNGVVIPPRATITKACLQFQADEKDTEATALTIQGEAHDNPPTFAATDGNISSRARTAAAVKWAPGPWPTRHEAGPNQQTPGVAAVIQEVVNRPGWTSGNSLVIIITGTGKRVAEAYDGDQVGAPLLHVEYGDGSGNQGPTATIDAPADGATFNQGDGVNFAGSASDLEDGDVTASLQWVSDRDGVIGSGGSVTRSDLSVGVHTITATATDSGGLTASDNVEIKVFPTATVLVGAGDIAGCSSQMDLETALLLDGVAGTVVTLGDNVYPDGTDDQFSNCYEPTWGRHKGRTRPSPGNHDYHTPGASGYFNYFGAAAGQADKGYYSYDVGDWHIIVLNSNCGKVGGCESDSPQGQWLQADLAANPAVCTLAYWHHPRFSSSSKHGSDVDYQDFWQLLYDAGADVVLNGHDHTYERFGPQDPIGNAAPGRGMREFVVGTGGAGLYPFGTPEPNSEVRENNTHGVLKLTLHPTSYDWEFIPITGQTFTDSGSASCVVLQDLPPAVTTTTSVVGGSGAGDASPVINVPGDAPSIQAAIDLAVDGDVVLVAPGEYHENIQIAGKTITLASLFHTTQDTRFIDETIIDGDGSTVITVEPNVGPDTKIIGFTIQNGDDGISAHARLHILNNRFTGNKDAIDYEDGGGFCRNNLFENNSDDGIDLDGSTEVTIEDNIVYNSGDDGIEIRLHAYSGPTLNIVIRHNIISGNNEDGIQLIDHPGESDRVILIERNLIQDSAMAGLGLMDNGDSKQDFRGASIPDRIHLFNNTFVGNGHGLTGGDNLIALNNLFVGSPNIALKNVDGDSIAAYNLFWENGTDIQNSNVDTASTISADPGLDENNRLLPESPAIDAGTASFTWNSESVLELQPGEYSGTAPDLGAHEAQAEPPITNPQPPSTLLLPGTTGLSLSVQSSENTTCAFSSGVELPYDQMTPFDQGAGTTVHQTTVSNLDPDPNVVNHVYVRCASHPDYVLQLKYRSLSHANPSYPRTGKLWGWWDLYPKGLAYMARIDLWLAAAGATADEIRALRRLNPNLRILTNINAVDGSNLPDDYYLKDIHGNRIETWPNSYTLNLTKPYVAEYLAHYAYQRALESDMMFDGVFFDNVFTTQSWRKYDIYGNFFLVDADEDGVEDDPEVFDAAWKAGVFHELATFRALMPHAILSGHGMQIFEPGIAEIFNGRGLGFRTADVLEGEMIFADLWDEYHAWAELARQPHATMFESSPPDQIAYGYDYSPWDKIPPSTLEFARTFFPYVRFGLAVTLMNDGYFAHEFGDTWHGNDWWYDELDFDLGYPLGPAERVDLGIPPGDNQIVNGGFETAIDEPWRFQVHTTQGNIATVTRDTVDKAVGAAAARIDVVAASGVYWHISLAQYNRSLEQGVVYDVSFRAKSDAQRRITVGAQKNNPDWRNYGLRRDVLVDTEWKKYVVSFEANETADDARIQFMVGETSGTVWVDDVSMTVRPPDVYQREFTNGVVLLNGSADSQEITVGPGYSRLQGQQAPRYETIIDDRGAAFSTTGTWASVTYDSGEWQAIGPFYHCWQETCHERSGSQGEARWDLEIQAADTYTITAWWPAAPPAEPWNQNVTYEVVVGEQVVASETFDQRSGGDEWHLVAAVPLSPDNVNYVRMRCEGEAPCLADALHLRSRARYNDGSPAESVTVQPLDGIILARPSEFEVYFPIVIFGLKGR